MRLLHIDLISKRIRPIKASFLFIWLALGLYISPGLYVLPASSQEVLENRSLYRSDVDQNLTIRKITVLPLTDNIGGIYSRPVEQHLIKSIEDDHHWDYVEANLTGPVLSPGDLITNEQLVHRISQNLSADAFIVGKIVKGPNGLSMNLNLYLTADRKLLAQAEFDSSNRFEIEDVKQQAKELLNKIISKIPYNGLILSRHGNRVTMNLGKKDGVNKNQVVTVIQVIKENRHPKFNFLISTEKEILGRIKILKVDETLSFGMILTEKEKGAIQVNSKISGLDFVDYGDFDSLESNTSDRDKLMQRPDSQMSFGDKAVAWLPKRQPTFGRVGGQLSLGMFNGNLQQTSESLDAKATIYPSVYLDGELWLTETWSMHALLRQGIISFDNPKSGSTPSELSASLSQYELLAGYNLRMGSSIWSPQIEFLGGYSYYRLFVDDSDPRGLTTMNYSGLKLGLKGSYPVTADQRWHAGAQLFFFFQSNLKESPSASGTGGDNTINQFGAFAYYRWKVNIILAGGLDFELYSTSFSGGNASSASHKHTLLHAGAYYYF